MISRNKLKCSCGNCTVEVSPGMVSRLELFEKERRTQVTITSGGRCKIYNKEIKGAAHSAHVPQDEGRFGEAIDCYSFKMTAWELFKLLRKSKLFNRIGYNKYKNFCHIDRMEPKHPYTCIEWNYTEEGKSMCIKRKS